MARGINKVILIGNLGNDPEVRAMPSGAIVSMVSIATSEKWKDKNTGDEHNKTEWHRVIFFNRVAEIARDYLKKGSKIYVEGKLQTRKWKDNQGVERYITEIIAHGLQMLDSHANAFEEAKAGYTPQSMPSAPQQEAVPFDDDIPF